MPVLLQPARVRGPALQTRAHNRGMVPRLPGGARPRRAAARPLGRRADAAARPRGAGAHRARPGLYSSPITSAYRLTRERLAGLKKAGLDHVQISVQGANAELSNEI